jgi:hypothetical protein
METKLFSIILCLLVLETSSSSLKNLTSIQHGTENASARSFLASTYEDFSFFEYGKKHYDIIYPHIPTYDKKNQFAFLMIARSFQKRWWMPRDVSIFLKGTEDLPNLKTEILWPPGAFSNLVIAGVTYEGKPEGVKDLPFHAENKLLDVMLTTMDEYYDETYGLFCPWLIVLGSKFDTCCGNKRCQGKTR